MSYPFPEIGEITMQNDWKSIRGVAKTHVLHFRESSKIPTYLLWYFDDLETRFPEFHEFHLNVTFYALKGSVSWNLRKSAEFDPQNHQYSLGNIAVLSFSDSHENIAELVVFTVPKLMFWVKSAKMSRGDPFG